MGGRDDGPARPSGSVRAPSAASATKFYGCYLLVSVSEQRTKGRTYIGFTVNPKRRIRQHNGELAMGACSTRSGRPWEMVLVVHGFSSKAKALAFEWAWQHPRRSRSIKEKILAMKASQLRGVKGKARILRELLCSETFASEAKGLGVQVLDSKYSHVLPCLHPSDPVPVTVSPLASLALDAGRASSRDDETEEDSEENFGGDFDEEVEASWNRSTACMICFERLIEGCSAMGCRCGSVFHINCLEKHFLGRQRDGRGECPVCQYEFTLDESLSLGREMVPGAGPEATLDDTRGSGEGGEREGKRKRRGGEGDDRNHGDRGHHEAVGGEESESSDIPPLARRLERKLRPVSPSTPSSPVVFVPKVAVATSPSSPEVISLLSP